MEVHAFFARFGGKTMRKTVCLLFLLVGVALNCCVSHAADDGTVMAPVAVPKCDNPGVFINWLGMKFTYIPPGTFRMGSPESESGRFANEAQHMVRLTKGFYLQTTEVTQGQWKAVMWGANPSVFNTCGDDCPVENVSWDDIRIFLFWLNYWSAGEGEGKLYRLPTEAEWEYAARAGSTTAFANGDISVESYSCTPVDPNLDLMGWYCGNAGGSGSTHPVARKQPNAWGLYDMHGNAYEWVQDWYDEDYGLDPVRSVTDPAGPSAGTSRVYRGGSSGSAARGSRSAFRYGFGPLSSSQYYGFRLARSVP